MSPLSATETQEPSPSLDREETSKEAREAVAPQAWASPMEEAPQAQEPPRGQGSPSEDLMFVESPEQAVLAAPVEPTTADPSVADTHAADTIETATATADTTVANNVTAATASLNDLWPGNGEGASVPQAEPRAPTPPSGAEVTLAEVPLLDEVAQEPLPPAGESCANLLNFDELPEPPATFCDPEEEIEGEPLAAPQAPILPTTLEEVDQEPEPEQELEPEPHLLTNGETTQKEGTQVGHEQPDGRGEGSSRRLIVLAAVSTFLCDPYYRGKLHSTPPLWASSAFVPKAGIRVSLATTDGIIGCWGNWLSPDRSTLVLVGGA